MAKTDNANAKTETPGAAQLERKLTNKALFSAAGKKPELPRDNDGNPVEMELGTVFGIARGTKSGESANGPWLALTGSFEARTHDGRRLQAPQVFLPDPLNSMIAEQLADPETESLEFAVKVKMVPSNVPIGYEYKTETIVEPSGADPLAQLRQNALPGA